MQENASSKDSNTRYEPRIYIKARRLPFGHTEKLAAPATAEVTERLTASYIPQNNGGSERKNRTVVEMATFKYSNEEINFLATMWAELVIMEIKRFDDGSIKIYQKEHAKGLLECFNFSDCRPVSTPMIGEANTEKKTDHEFPCVPSVGVDGAL
ncbi:hypothetical protein ILUMI_17849, partial [Ignelater luminosus]